VHTQSGTLLFQKATFPNNENKANHLLTYNIPALEVTNEQLIQNDIGSRTKVDMM